MKPKTARKELRKRQYMFARISYYQGRRTAIKYVRKWLDVLKKDRGNPASLKLRNEFLFR